MLLGGESSVFKNNAHPGAKSLESGTNIETKTPAVIALAANLRVSNESPTAIRQ